MIVGRGARLVGPCAFVVLLGCAPAPVRVARVEGTRVTDGVPAKVASHSLELRVVTFNAGLAVGVVPYASERVEPLARALSKIEADLVCLQEVWLEKHWETITQWAATSLPHVVRPRPEVVTGSNAMPEGAACSEKEVEPLASCVKSSCLGLASDALGACVLAHCRASAKDLSDRCGACLIADPTGTASSIFGRCVGAKATEARPGSARFIAYGGSPGLGILTHETILAEDVLRLESDLNARAAVYVRLRTEALGEVDAFCTHLTPDDNSVTPPKGRTWHEVHEGEVSQLNRWISEKSDGTRPVILLGDFNAGPTVSPSIEARLADDYEELLSSGWVNRYPRDPKAVCTYCDANPLNGGASSKTGTIIDHILTKSFTGTMLVEPVLRESVDLAVGARTVRGAYSDHYGLRATLSRRP